MVFDKGKPHNFKIYKYSKLLIATSLNLPANLGYQYQSLMKHDQNSE